METCDTVEEFASEIEFLVFLWGMETLCDDRQRQSLVPFLVFLWGMETGRVQQPRKRAFRF